ncbi:hypothetical protein GMDG_02025 [Pseudogymnoascus destructans 20631-21]|uniref:Uncharacterized protein n=1 Tax=Pseudogymnoascus destructans (strain ATCC MYA-4855 / 20631-21) TaxID=658429 RepID=L8FYZ3_PSED2|nr:hypothetical protein GMDG_02025 [Pseudogymnoascus destructans 20631-21]
MEKHIEQAWVSGKEMERLKSELFTFHTITVPYSFLKCHAGNNTPQNANAHILALSYAFACSSSPRDLIALLNALIIPSYIISLSRNVPVKIAPSLIGKRAFRSSRESVGASNIRSKKTIS